MKNNILSFLKGVFFGLIMFIIGYYFTIYLLDNDKALSELGDCITEQALIDGNTSTPRELWNTYAEFCKEFIDKKSQFQTYK